MKGVSTEDLVYDQLFPKARANDPQNFQAFCTRCLIGEVRSETQAFYGHLDTQEAKFPGLDYNDATHRIRLGRFTWHRRLFRAFDTLGLTPSEIDNLTRWEGTKWAKDKYEKEHGVIIRDTASDDIPTWDDELGAAVYDSKYAPPQIEIVSVDDDVSSARTATPEQQSERSEEAVQHQEEDEEDEEDIDAPTEQIVVVEAPATVEASEPELESVGVSLNARLREGAARREAGDTNAVLDEEWEQWIKAIIDSGLLHEDMSDTAFQQFFDSIVMPAGLVPVDVMSAARAGSWDEVPQFLHAILRRTLEAEQARGPWNRATARAANIPTTPRTSRRNFSDLRLRHVPSLASPLTAEPLASPLVPETPGA